MTSEWDKLWLSIELEIEGSIGYVDADLSKIKAVGDKIQSRLNDAIEYFEHHCKMCDAEDCFGCSYAHIKGLLGMPIKSDKLGSEDKT